MSSESNILNNAKRPTFQILRSLFICGYIIGIGLTFIPSIEVSHRGVFGMGEVQKQTYSSYQIIRLMGAQKQFGWQIFYVTLFAFAIAFLILSVTYPRRWVFISGASITAFFLLLDFFTPANEDIERIVIPTVLGYLADVFVLLGFIIKPQSTISTNK